MLDGCAYNQDKEVMRINGTIKNELDSTGLPYELKMGGRHIKIVLAGRMVGILPKVDGKDAHSRAIKNTIAQIRRAQKEING